MPAMVETSHYGPRLRALVGLLGGAFPLRFSKTQALLAQLLGVEISRGAIAEIRQRLSAALEPSTMFLQGLSRSTAAAIELLGSAFEGIVVSDRFSAYNHLPVEQRQLCWAHLIRDLSAIAERQGVSGEIGRELLALQQQLFVQWHQWKDGAIDWPMA